MNFGSAIFTYHLAFLTHLNLSHIDAETNLGRMMMPEANDSLAYLTHHDVYPDARIRAILRQVKTIAMVGASAVWRRPSFYAMKYLQKK